MDGVDVQQHGQAADHDDNCRVTAAGAGAALTSGRVYFLHDIPLVLCSCINLTLAVLTGSPCVSAHCDVWTLFHPMLAADCGSGAGGLLRAGAPLDSDWRCGDQGTSARPRHGRAADTEHSVTFTDTF